MVLSNGRSTAFRWCRVWTPPAVVTAVGPGVTGISVGDEVMASASDKPYYGGGTFAELVAVPVQAVAKKPVSIDIKAASTLPLAGLTALAAIEAIEPQSGQTIAVIGATGAVGSFFVQFAAKRGATVVALARPGELRLCPPTGGCRGDRPHRRSGRPDPQSPSRRHRRDR